MKFLQMRPLVGEEKKNNTFKKSPTQIIDAEFIFVGMCQFYKLINMLSRFLFYTATKNVI